MLTSEQELRKWWAAADNLPNGMWQGEQHKRRTALWLSVLKQHVDDALFVDPKPGEPINRKDPDSQKRAQALTEKAAAIDWLLRGRSFGYVASNAGLEPDKARESIKRHLEANGVQT